MINNIVKNTSKYINKNNLLVVGLVLCVTSFTFLSLALIFYKPPKVARAQENPDSFKVDFWTNFLSIHPTYFEGWIELTNFYINEGYLEKAKEAYVNAKNIDPNSEKLIILRLKLGIRE